METLSERTSVSRDRLYVENRVITELIWEAIPEKGISYVSRKKDRVVHLQRD